MCQLHFHSSREDGAKRYMEHVNKYKNKILEMLRREKPIYDITTSYSLSDA